MLMDIVDVRKYGNARISRSSVLFPLPRPPVMIRWRFGGIEADAAIPDSDLLPAISPICIFRKDLSIELAAALNTGVAVGFIVM